MNRFVSGLRGGAWPRGATRTRPGCCRLRRTASSASEESRDREDHGVDQQPDRPQAGLHEERNGQEQHGAQPLGDPHHAGRDEAPVALREDGAVPGQEVGATDGGGGPGDAHHGRDRHDGDGGRDEMELLEEHHAGQHEAARLAQREDAERYPAQVPVGATKERRDEQLGRAERVREDADDRGRGDRGSQREQERDRRGRPRPGRRRQPRSPRSRGTS